MDFENIVFEVKDRVGKITINRPPANVIDIETLHEMIAAIEEVKKSKEIKVLILSGAGEKAFSTGVSVPEHLPDKVDEAIPTFGNLFRTMLSLEQPTIAVVKGYCLGGGCEVACFCDMVIAAEGAQFGQPEIKLAVYPPLAIPAFPRIMGQKKAFEFLLTGDTIDAKEAQRVGLVNMVVPEAELEEAVDKFVAKLTVHSLVALKASKRALYAGYDLPLAEALKISEDIYLNVIAKSKDGVEGLRAFLEKRKPVWRDE
jgi:cyclohexa-1,5-dienecarbonyl-CoA hydratase